MIFSLFLLPLVIVFDFFFSVFSSFRRGTFTESFFGEWITRKATFKILKKIIKKKISLIYVTFMGYDSRAHPFGRENKLALSILRKIDKTIENIFKLAKDDYEIFVLSDHGQVDTILFRDIYGKTLSEKIRDFTQKQVINSDDIKKMLIFKSLDLKKKLAKSRLLKVAFSLIYRMGERYYQNDYLKRLPYYKLKKENIIFIDQGDMAQIYLGEFPKEKMGEKDINKFYPGLIRWLFNLKEISTVSFISRQKVKILTKDKTLKRNNNYLSFIKELTMMENSGDIIIFGKRTGKNRNISFAPDKRSVHGGIERGEQEGFFLLPLKYRRKIKNNLEPIDLYKFFIDK